MLFSRLIVFLYKKTENTKNIYQSIFFCQGIPFNKPNQNVLKNKLNLVLKRKIDKIESKSSTRYDHLK
jgi:hypothetical protein